MMALNTPTSLYERVGVGWGGGGMEGQDEFNFVTVLNCKCRRNGWQRSRRMRGGRLELRKPDRLGCHIRQMRGEGTASHLAEVKSSWLSQ